MGKQVIYSSFFSQEKYEKAKQSLKEIGIENINEDDISDQMLFFDYLDAEGFQLDLDSLMDGKLFIMECNIERWNGSDVRYKIVKNYNDIMEVLRCCDEIEVSDIDGHLYISGSHHDGTNTYQLKELNARGVAYYERWNETPPWEDSRTEPYICKKLVTSKYSKLPRYWEQLYGKQEG